jgi:hypothetical protein
LFLAKSGEGVSQAGSMQGVAVADGRFPQGVPKKPQSTFVLCGFYFFKTFPTIHKKITQQSVENLICHIV